MVRLNGVIGMGSALRPGLTHASIASTLDKAFAMKAPCVALSVNSPGGSPVQSSLIFSRIRALSAEHERPVITFVEDVAASGGYWLAAAGDEIFVDPSSVVGSIGVITASFGFTELIEKIGVERRVYTAGENKSLLDPFKPENDRDISILRAVQADIYEAFVESVKARRGDRLSNDGDLFTGQFWSGTAGVRLGLVDGIGSARAVLKERYGKKTRIRVMSPARPSLFRLRGSVQDTYGPEALIGALRSDQLFGRYGL
ncbi:MAG: S49 family peptidase [Pseudomonadota bacterium]